MRARPPRRRGSRQRFVEDGYGPAYIAGLGFGFRQGNLYETVKNQDVLRAPRAAIT
jgi:hypothetical protein